MIIPHKLPHKLPHLMYEDLPKKHNFLDTMKAIFQKLIHLGTDQVEELDQKSKIIITNVSIIHALISTAIVFCLILHEPIYLFIYCIYIPSMFGLWYMIYKGKFFIARRLIYYLTVSFLCALSLVSGGKFLTEYILIIVLVIDFAELQERKYQFYSTCFSAFCLSILLLNIQYGWINYGVPKNMDIIFFINLFVIIFLLINTLFTFSNQVYSYKNNLDVINAQLQIKAQDLAEANAQKDTLFSIIGHDLKHPFNSIQGLLSLIENKSLDAETELSIINRIRITNNATVLTLENLLQWGVSMQKNIEFVKDVVSVKATIDTISQMLEENIGQKQITFKNEIGEAVKVSANSHHFSLILRNLISNAIKFSKPKGNIEVSCIEHEKEWEIRVKDEGVGIKEENMSKIFDKNSLFTTKGTKQEGGTGLGLILCKDFVEKNEGRISVESMVNEGTTFSIFLAKA